MGLRFRAIYRNGALVPVQPLALPEESLVELEMPTHDSVVSPPTINPQDRGEVFGNRAEKSVQTPVYRIAGLFTRDELYDRQ